MKLAVADPSRRAGYPIDVPAADLPCEASLAYAVRPMKAKASLYWRLNDGMLTFDVIDTEEDGDGLRVLNMRDFCLETWKLVAGDGTTWTLKDTSVRFYRALESMFGELKLRRRRHEFEIVGVVDGFLFFRQSGILLSIDLETMRLRMLSDQDCSPATIYPYTKTRAWPPSFLNPIE